MGKKGKRCSIKLNTSSQEAQIWFENDLETEFAGNLNFCANRFLFEFARRMRDARPLKYSKHKII